MRLSFAVFAIVLLAGCADSWNARQDASRDGGSPEPGTAADGSATAPPFDAVWVLPDCRYMRLTMNHDRGSGSEGLPPDHELQGEGVATLALLAADCPVAVIGNVTVVEPFRYAVLYHILRPMSDDFTQIDTFAREVVVSTPLAAAWLAATGLPVAVGNIAFSAPGEAYEVAVTAPGVQILATGAQPLEGADSDSSSFSYRFRDGDDARSTWFQDDLKLVSRTNTPAALVVQAEAGYLSTAFPLGTTLARIEESYGASVLTAHLEVHG